MGRYGPANVEYAPACIHAWVRRAPRWYITNRDFVNGNMWSVDRPSKTDHVKSLAAVVYHASWTDDVTWKRSKFEIIDQWHFSPECEHYDVQLDAAIKGGPINDRLMGASVVALVQQTNDTALGRSNIDVGTAGEILEIDTNLVVIQFEDHDGVSYFPAKDVLDKRKFHILRKPKVGILKVGRKGIHTPLVSSEGIPENYPYYMVEGGTSCPVGDVVTSQQECENAGKTLSKPLHFNVRAKNGDDRPVGCFWDINGFSYFNPVDNAGWTGWTGVGGICKNPLYWHRFAGKTLTWSAAR